MYRAGLYPSFPSPIPPEESPPSFPPHYWPPGPRGSARRRDGRRGAGPGRAEPARGGGGGVRRRGQDGDPHQVAGPGCSLLAPRGVGGMWAPGWKVGAGRTGPRCGVRCWGGACVERWMVLCWPRLCLLHDPPRSWSHQGGGAACATPPQDALGRLLPAAPPPCSHRRSGCRTLDARSLPPAPARSSRCILDAWEEAGLEEGPAVPQTAPGALRAAAGSASGALGAGGA